MNVRALTTRLVDLLRTRVRPGTEDSLDKESWELEWQKTKWVPLFTEPATRQKCLDYWRRFRHLDDIVALVQPGEDSRILDVGCGLSTVLHFLPGRRFGIDPLAEDYKRLYAYPEGIQVVAGYGEAIPFGAESFDLVTCSNCIDHTSDPKSTMDEIHRVLTTDGWLALTCEVFRRDLGLRNAGHPHSMTRKRLFSLLRRFEIVQHWDSPWFGLRAYVLGQGPTQQREHIFLARKSSARGYGGFGGGTG